MKILITGISGFVGSYLAEFLLQEVPNAQIFGTIRWRSRMENLESIKEKIELIECDLKDLSSVKNALEIAKPDFVFHLAAQSYVATSFHAPQDTITNNILSQLNLFEAIRALRLSPIIQIAGSSEEYGLVYENEIPVREENPLRPLSPYAVSKVGQDLLAYQYYQSYKIPLVRTRAFNHSGPRRGHVFVESNFAKQIAEIEKGIKPPILQVGNLNAIRDFTDVRDMVRAYWLAVTKGKPGEVYNISSGKGYSVAQIVELYRNMTEIPIGIQQDPHRLRPSDVPILIGDSTKFRTETGWKPTIPFEQTLKDILNYWRTQIEAMEKSSKT